MASQSGSAAAKNRKVTKRLHLSGLAPSVKQQDVAQRFASFGTVDGGPAGVAGLGVDANGQPRPFAFLTLETTEQQLKKCMSMLSGSMWKGHKLRIAFAKPDYTQRLEKERKEAAALAAKPKAAKRKRRRKLGPNMALLAKRFEIVTPENIQHHRGWTLDTETPTPVPIFPLLTRPPHPIKPPKKPAQTAWSRGTSKKKQKPARDIVPLIRARRMRIDPRKWGRQKLIFTDDRSNSFGPDLRGVWECDEEVQKQSAGQALVTWVFKSKDGEIKRKEVVSLSRQEAHTDKFAALLDRMEQSAGTEAPVQEDLSALATKATEEDDDLVARPRKRLKSASPPPYVPAAPRALLYNDEDAFALAEAAQDAQEQARTRLQERNAQLGVLQGILDRSALENKDSEATSTLERKLPTVEGFADDSDDDLQDLLGQAHAIQPTLRLRGGAASSDSDSSADDPSDSDSDDTSSTGDERDDAAKTLTTETDKPKTVLAKKSLKDMFKAKDEQMISAGSFSLLSGLDLELEPVERTPTPPPQRPPPPPYTAPTQPVRAVARQNAGASATFRPPLPPFFLLPGQGDDGSFESKQLQALQALGLDTFAVGRHLSENRRLLERDAASFWRHEEDIESKHQQLRDALQGVPRKRHREAVKKQGKSGKGAGGRRNTVEVLDEDDV
ncbi:hypothetical protein OIV83_003232 [Microbotryomycetes sp. JL201]|nr:hypothetical protein OIV83_003232 [Microbotryomycetes sp. JL201]